MHEGVLLHAFYVIKCMNLSIFTDKDLTLYK